MSFSNPLGAIGEIFHNRGLSNKQKVTGMLGAAARTFPVGAITLYGHGSDYYQKPANSR